MNRPPVIRSWSGGGQAVVWPDAAVAARAQCVAGKAAMKALAANRRRTRRTRPKENRGLVPNMHRPGLRFYSPRLGRWMSRDPLGEAAFCLLSAGMGEASAVFPAELAAPTLIPLYGWLGNSATDRWDYLGMNFWDYLPITSSARLQWKTWPGEDVTDYQDIRVTEQECCQDRNSQQPDYWVDVSGTASELRCQRHINARAASFAGSLLLPAKMGVDIGVVALGGAIAVAGGNTAGAVVAGVGVLDGVWGVIAFNAVRGRIQNAAEEAKAQNCDCSRYAAP